LKPVVSIIRRWSNAETQAATVVLVVNSRSIWGYRVAGVKRVSGRWAMGNLDDETAAPLTELEREKVKLLTALAAEVWERTAKGHVLESRNNNLFECSNHLVAGFAHPMCIETPNIHPGRLRTGELAFRNDQPPRKPVTGNRSPPPPSLERGGAPAPPLVPTSNQQLETSNRRLPS
jgi:hypothetical protein